MLTNIPILVSAENIKNANIDIKRYKDSETNNKKTTVALESKKNIQGLISCISDVFLNPLWNKKYFVIFTETTIQHHIQKIEILLTSFLGRLKENILVTYYLAKT